MWFLTIFTGNKYHFTDKLLKRLDGILLNKIYLCGHTGSINRGCEAIVKSTVAILREAGAQSLSALTYDIHYDKRLRLNNEITLIPYPRKSRLIRGMSYLQRRLFKNPLWGTKFWYKELFRTVQKDDLLFNIGGDTYCYGTPYTSYALNVMAQKSKIPNIFWGCSVNGNTIENEQMRRDIDRYSFIVSRESYSFEILKKCVSNPEKVYLACDPAFRLKAHEVELPEFFTIGNTVGLNLSPLVFSDMNDDNDMMYQNARCLIDYVIENTDMNVCLIPHVYNVERNLQDSAVLGKIYARYAKTGRVGIVNEELSCSQLKHIISKCRFFIGARTHATIAAYSSSVPTIALSYSIKSRGLAKDLFGTEDGYVIRWRSVKHPTELTDALQNTLMRNEQIIRSRYETFLPGYKQTILDAAKDILSKVGK